MLGVSIRKVTLFCGKSYDTSPAYTKPEKNEPVSNDDALPRPQMKSPGMSIGMRVMNSLTTGIHLYDV